MARIHVIGAAAASAALLAAGATVAAPVGLAWEVGAEFFGGQEYRVGRLYLCYDDPADTLLGVFNVSIAINGGQFNHNDVTTAGTDAPVGSWSPNAFLPPILGKPAIDSWLTIGGSTSSVIVNANSTSFDPSFDGGAGSTVTGGWFNSDPANLQGKSSQFPGQTGWCTLIGQFVVAGEGMFGSTIAVSLTQTSNQGLGTPNYPQTEYSGLFDWCGCPAPGGLAVLGLAGIAGRPRRRHSRWS